MKTLTAIVGHQDFNNSIANKTILQKLKEHYPDLPTRILSELYPDFNIDIESEQENLSKSDIILLLFPIYWYNVPAILKLWIDRVLTFGFAFGIDGDKLKGKTLLVCATAGGNKQSYTPIGNMHFRLRPFINNIESTAYYCQMNFADPVLGYDNVYIPNVVNTPEIVISHATEQSERLISVLDQLLKS